MVESCPPKPKAIFSARGSLSAQWKKNMSCACLHLPSRIMVCSGKWASGLYRKRFLLEPLSTCMIVGGRIPRKHRPLQKVTCMSRSLMRQQPFKLRLTEHITVSYNLQTKLTRTHINFTLLKLAKICKCNHKNKRNKHWQTKNIRSMIRTQISSVMKTWRIQVLPSYASINKKKTSPTLHSERRFLKHWEGTRSNCNRGIQNKNRLFIGWYWYLTKQL